MISISFTILIFVTLCNDSVTFKLNSNLSPINGRSQNSGIIHFVEENPTPTLGSPCRRKFDQSGGFCVSIKSCYFVVQEYRKSGIPIDICSFSGIIPIVCCPFEKFPQITAKRSQLRKSAAKCEEYKKIISMKVKYFELAADSLVQERILPQCDYNVPLIVGGETTKPGEFPHMAALGWKTGSKEIEWLCGGSLISERFVITAAHCAIAKGKPPQIVRLGEQNLESNEDGANPVDIDIEQIITHPSYRPNSYYHDIALIKLRREPFLNKFIRPACLWQLPEFNFTQVVATGWGKLHFSGKKSDDLQKVGLGIIDNIVCNNFYDRGRKLTKGIIEKQFCAGYLDGGKDTCQGDSGGPVQVAFRHNPCLHYIVGITSFGRFCAAPNSPGVYTKIYHYLDWIEEIAFGNFDLSQQL